jgi:hypothetical protein
MIGAPGIRIDVEEDRVAALVHKGLSLERLRSLL